MDTVRVPGSKLLHPIAIASLAVLVLNDHWLKSAHPGFWSGKLSDMAGLVLLPITVQAMFELVAARLRGRAPLTKTSNRVLWAATVAIALAFALPELWLPAEMAYRIGLGALQWPFRALAALWAGSPMPSLAPVRATADPTDLLALPFVLVALAVGRHRDPKRALGLGAAAVSSMLLVLTAAPASSAAATPADAPAPAKKPGAYEHNGFYMAGEMGGGALVLDSEASISNGFQQPIPSSATGDAFPTVTLGLGGTLPGIGLVVGGRLLYGEAHEPAIETLDETFTLRGLTLSMIELAAFARYYLDRHRGFHVGGGIGLFGVDAGLSDGIFESVESFGGDAQRGPSLSLDSGISGWISSQLSLGALVELRVAALDSPNGSAFLFMPTIAASFVWH